MAKKKDKSPAETSAENAPGAIDADADGGLPGVSDEQMPGATDGNTPVPTDESTGGEPPPSPPPPVSPPTPRQDFRELTLAVDIALGNGNRKRGDRLGSLRTAMGVTLDECFAVLLADDCRCEDASDGMIAIMTTRAIEAAGRTFPVRSHLANLSVADGVSLGEVMTALRNHGVALK